VEAAEEGERVMMGELRSHIERKIAEAELFRYPFPHLIIDDFFPSEVYRNILEKNPFRSNSGVEWFTKAKSPRKTHTPYWTRKQINFHTDQEWVGDAEQREFWSEIKDCFLADHWFEQIVLGKYKEYFVLRFGELVEAENFFGFFRKELFLQRHEPGYYIGPHTDVPTRIFTCIFSFADREGFEEYGTELCVHKNPLIRCWGNNHYPPDDFTVKKIAPYKPNNFLLFFKTRQSFHSVKAIDETVPNERYGMQFQLYETRNGVFLDLSEPDLLAPGLDGPTVKAKLRQLWSIVKG
jgi:hypothetical protein